MSNAWDALATDVQIKVSDDLSEITILDDGVGMSEADIRERFLRIGGSKAAGVATRGGRRLIGHKGIGALSVINICKEVRVLTTQQGSTERMEVALDISKVLELAKQDEDLESHYVYELTKWSNEEKNSHYTYITLRNLTPDMREFLSKKGVTVDQYISNVGELSGIEQLKWELSLVGGNLAIAVVFIFIAAYSRYLGLYWSRLLAGITVTLGSLYLVEGVTSAITGHYPPALVTHVRQIRQIANILAVISWIIVILSPWGERVLTEEGLRKIEAAFARIEASLGGRGGAA